MLKQKVKGRFAPTPSGSLHLGNIFCCLLAWLSAKSKGGQIVLRIEDLDTARCPRVNADKLATDLEWLGLTWDEGAYTENTTVEYFQSQRFDIYHQYFEQLQKQNAIYPCFCSRNELHAVNAPHLSDGRIIYPGTCYHLSPEERLQKEKTRRPAYRLHVPDKDIFFTDGNYGSQTFNLAKENGDFIVRRSDGVYAYQLAVTVDDALMGVTEVVRGWDLLSSSPLQIYLYSLLGLQVPSFTHVPLLVAQDGRRLAKRDHDMDIAMMRKEYSSPEPIIGYVAFLAGQLKKPEPITVADLLKIYNPASVPTQNIVVPNQLPKLY